MDYHKDMVMPCNLHGSPTLRSLQFHYTLHTRNLTYQKWLYLKGLGFTFSKPSFLGIQPLVFGGVVYELLGLCVVLGGDHQDFSVAAGHHAITGRVGTLVFMLKIVMLFEV